MNKKVRSDSIAFKLALTFVVSVVIQSLLMTALLSLGGVPGQCVPDFFRESEEPRGDNRRGDEECLDEF